METEWLVTNGLGGYASAPVAGGLTRRYHGLLIASLPAPLGRMLYLSHLRTVLGVGPREFVIDHEDTRCLADSETARLREFRLEGGQPIWTYEAGSTVFERRVVMAAGQNTVHVIFTLLEGEEHARLLLWPLLHVRPHEAAVSSGWDELPRVTAEPDGFLVTPAGLPPMRWHVSGAAPVVTTFTGPEVSSVEYLVEQSRGYDFAAKLWSPGWLEMPLHRGEPVAFSASTEDWQHLLATGALAAWDQERTRRGVLLTRAAAENDVVLAELVLAADQFVITPVGHGGTTASPETEAVRPPTTACSIIAGYHWFTDWGRDTMISLEGLALETGRTREAGQILRTFAQHVRDGLIPNFFPEGEHEGVYHTADATLWFFHALDRYVARTGDTAIIDELLPSLVAIVERHLAGTRFGIGVDPEDGLLAQGAAGYQLTWMDAKVGDWVVTPRRGKAVEINALWYNALHVVARWLEQARRPEQAEAYRIAAARTRQSFNHRFWNEQTRHLYDVVDGEQGDDPACRPNQILSMALPHPVLDQTRWSAVLEVAERTLLTPVGLRSLAPGHPDYQARYFGDLKARDAAYHQGTVWGWLIGPFVDAWLRVHPGEETRARQFLTGFLPHLDQACVGSISEVFDGENPFTPRGCIAQAWSVAETLRVWRKTGGSAGRTPPVD
ncbi:MAG: amylo-alpha-1,6-glucosidase [Vicinamibacterales bacterium]